MYEKQEVQLGAKARTCSGTMNLGASWAIELVNFVTLGLGEPHTLLMEPVSALVAANHKVLRVKHPPAKTVDRLLLLLLSWRWFSQRRWGC